MASGNNASVPEEDGSKRNGEVPEWILASRGIKLILNNNSEEAVQLFLQYPDSLVMFAGYSFAVFMDALMSYEEEKLSTAISVLKEVEKRCCAENGWLRHVTNKMFGSSEPKPQRTLAEQLETQVILADSQVCIAILTFLQQDISGYFKGGWVLRKAWKVYQRVYKDILQLYKDHIGELCLPEVAQFSVTTNQSSSENDAAADWDIPTTHTNGYTQKSTNIPHSKSSFHIRTPNGDEISRQKTNETLQKNTGCPTTLTGLTTGGPKLNSFTNSFSLYGLPSPLSMFSSQSTMYIVATAISDEAIQCSGFAANRQDGIACLMYARLGNDMRAPLASLSLLWYHTIVRPFYAIDGTNVQAGVDASTILLRESQADFKHSALFSFFRGRVCRLKSDTKSALLAFQQAADNTNQREIKTLACHEMGWCHLIELDYCAAENTFTYLKSSSRWSKSFYAYLAAICAGACDINLNLCLFEDLRNGVLGVPKGTQLEEFLSRRARRCPSNLNEIRNKTVLYWKLLVFEMLYLWNALPSCSRANITLIIKECNGITDEFSGEPMTGLSKLVLGCAHCILGMFDEGVLNFRKCLEDRKNIAPSADDAHISAFAQYELGCFLIRREETRPEGKQLLQGISQYIKYDFQQKLDVRVYSLLKTV
ncbi:hypothetical protein NQ317_005590 [Molorchus minor]|uniref:Tetratricopeptide repeat protein 39C n=1 Tax=Molorchus minor TaxID=1323400 RepID=A0ABQ9K9B4_9CUCU|nr:hypothetical protein NQ317_005590 [Molorchus minor]